MTLDQLRDPRTGRIVRLVLPDPAALGIDTPTLTAAITEYNRLRADHDAATAKLGSLANGRQGGRGPGPRGPGCSDPGRHARPGSR